MSTKYIRFPPELDDRLEVHVKDAEAHGWLIRETDFIRQLITEALDAREAKWPRETTP